MKQLHRYLRTQKITQAALADQLGVAPSTLCLILSGSRKPGVALTKKIEEVTGIGRHLLRPDIYEAA